MRAIFMGTPEIAVASLEALGEVAEVVGVICQPDRPAGRGMQLHVPPVKAKAQSLGFDVLQPTKMKDGSVAAWMRAKNADVALVIAFGRILPKEVLETPRRGCMNLHASLLPRYRGAAPIQWAIESGERETGVCLMQMDEGLDTGPVYAEKRIAITQDETSGELSVRLGQVAAELVRSSLVDAVDGKLVAKPQDHANATLARILRKEDGLVDWKRPSRALHDHVRAMQPWPGAFTTLANGKTLKVIRSRPIDAQVSTAIERGPGVVLVADRGGVVVACGEGGREALAIVEAQPEGKRAMPTADLVNGRVLVAGARLGSPS